MDGQKLIPNDLKHFLDVCSLLGACFKVDGLTCLSKLLALLKCDFLLVVQVQHGTYQNQHVVVCLTVGIDFAHPLVQVLKALLVVECKANQNGLSIFIIHWCECSEPFFSGGIPELKFDVFVNHIALLCVLWFLAIFTLIWLLRLAVIKLFLWCPSALQLLRIKLGAKSCLLTLNEGVINVPFEQAGFANRTIADHDYFESCQALAFHGTCSSVLALVINVTQSTSHDGL